MGSLGATAAFVSAAPLDAETARCSAAACVVQVGAVFFRELRTRNSHAFSPSSRLALFLPRTIHVCPTRV